MELVIDARGEIRCLYDEGLDLAELSRPEIHRASQVEPDSQGRWWVDLRLSHGPVLGPFVQRSQALAAERDWLQNHWLLPPTF